MEEITAKRLAYQMGKTKSQVMHAISRILTKDDSFVKLINKKYTTVLTGKGADKIRKHFEDLDAKPKKPKNRDWMYSDLTVNKPNSAGIATHKFITGRKSF